jgi:hypothetical protein
MKWLSSNISLSVHHAGVERLCVAEDDVLGAVDGEQMAGPVGIWILIQRDFGQLAFFDLRGKLLG